MKKKTDTVGIFQGYQMLLCLAVAIFFLAEIFTHILFWILRVLAVICILAFFIGLLGTAAILKTAGWQKRSFPMRLMRIPMMIILGCLLLFTMPLLIKCIFAVIVSYVITLTIKPKEPTSY